MAFCIRESEYDPELYDIVSGPHSNCSSCPPQISELSFSEFIELKFPKLGMIHDDPDLFTVMIKDHQLSTRYEILTKPSVNPSDCSYFSFEEQCPEGFMQTGYAAGCEGESCDKICCRPEDPDYDVFICGKIVQGQTSYNDPWNFHFDSETVSFKYRNQIPSGTKIANHINDLEINNDVCFMFKDKSRIMKLKGYEYCGYPLLWNAVRSFDEEDEEYVQVGTCDGLCEDREQNHCYDYENFISKQYVQKIIDDSEQYTSNLDEDEVVDYFIENALFLSSLFESEDEDEFLEMISASSSSSSDEQYEESSYYHNIETSTNHSSPTLVSLSYGTNNISLRLSDSYFKFNVDQGSKISSIYSLAWHTEFTEELEWFGEISIQQGSSWIQDGNILSTSEFGSSLVTNLFSELVPLNEGSYTLKVSSSYQGPEVFFVLSIVLEQNV